MIFVKNYYISIHNVDLPITLKDLELTKQEEKGSFANFLA